MKYATEMAPGGITCIPSFITVGSGMQVMLRLIPQKFERLYYWCYWWKRFIKAAVQMASKGNIYTLIFIMIGSELSRGDTQT